MRLDGITVLDLTQLLPGPHATQLLADLGVDVVKIEPPGGDGLRGSSDAGTEDGVFQAVNRGKRSVVLDLKRDVGRRALRDLASEADVVIEGFRPGVVERLGADYETLRAENPDLVYCSLTGYGQTGPYNDRPGHDLSFAGVSGMLDRTRRSRDDRPAPPPFSFGDLAGGVFAAFAIAAALFARERGGGGYYVDVSMLDVLVSLSQSQAPSTLAGEEPPFPGPFSGMYPCYDVYETADGKYVTLSALEPTFWRRFCEVVGRPDLRESHLADDPAIREALREELEALFAKKTRDEWVETCAGEDTTVAPVNTLAEAFADPHVRARGMIDDDRDQLGFPARTEPAVEPATEGPPALGEHTLEALAAAGVADGEIDALLEDS